jgi:hypothetical protein
MVAVNAMLAEPAPLPHQVIDRALQRLDSFLELLDVRAASVHVFSLIVEFIRDRSARGLVKLEPACACATGSALYFP